MGYKCGCCTWCSSEILFSYGNALNGMFRLFQTSLPSNNLFLRKHLYYQFLTYCRVLGNHAQRVFTWIGCKYRLQSIKYRDRKRSGITQSKIFKSIEKRTRRKRINLALRNFPPPSFRMISLATHRPLRLFCSTM